MAYEFNGSNEYISSSDPTNALPVTLACWFNVQNATNNQVLVYIGDTGSLHKYQISAGGNTEGDPVRGQLQGTNSQNAFTSTGWTTNTWNHACGVAAALNSNVVYLNGGSSGTNTSNIVAQNTFNRVNIGANNDNNTPSIYAEGLIAEVGIWNVALTAAEIASLAKGVTCDKVRPQSLVFYAPLIRNLQEITANRTLTNNNTATVANHPRVYK